MKVLIVAPMPPDPDGAGAIPILLYAQLVGLSARDEVTLVTAVGEEPGEAAAVDRLVAEGFDVRAADRRQPRTAGRRWRRRWRLATAWLRGTPWRAAWFAEPGIQAILDGLERDGFDIAVVEDSAMAGFRLPAGAASVLSEHEVLRPRGVDWHPGTPSQWPGWAFRELDWRRRYRFQHKVWQRFDRVLAFTRRDAETIVELCPGLAGRVAASPFGLAIPEKAADAAAEQANTIVFSGNFTHQPNRDAAKWLAGEILPALRRLRPTARLRLVGNAPSQELLEMVGPGIEVVADPPRVEPYIASAAVVIAPVRTGGGMRMKVLQALAAGKAVVTTPRGAEGFDCFEGEPPLRCAGTAEGLAAATAELLGDDEARHRLGRRARGFAERHYSPAAWAARLEAAYRETIGMRGGETHG